MLSGEWNMTDTLVAAQRHFNPSSKVLKSSELWQGPDYSSVCSAVLCPVHSCMALRGAGRQRGNNVYKNGRFTAHLITFRATCFSCLSFKNFMVQEKAFRANGVFCIAALSGSLIYVEANVFLFMKYSLQAIIFICCSNYFSLGLNSIVMCLVKETISHWQSWYSLLLIYMKCR